MRALPSSSLNLPTPCVPVSSVSSGCAANASTTHPSSAKSATRQPTPALQLVRALCQAIGELRGELESFVSLAHRFPKKRLPRRSDRWRPALLHGHDSVEGVPIVLKKARRAGCAAR